MADDTKPEPIDFHIKHVTSGWHRFGPLRVCEHWTEFDAPIVDGVAQQVPLATRDGQLVHGAALAGHDGKPVPTRLRSYVGLVLEIPSFHGHGPGASAPQLQVRGRLRVGEDRLELELADFTE